MLDCSADLMIWMDQGEGKAGIYALRERADYMMM
jgi:hypothetical protein